MTPAPTGVLYLVATPIGNLEDITLRALRVLREVALIACEDTRHSRKLLAHYQISTPTLSYYRENEAERAHELIDRLLAGENIALISDAGMPLISDPGARLLAAAIAAGISVVPLPGASAPLLALAASGWSTPVAWLGFLPPRTGERQRSLEAWKSWPGTLLLLESPHRIAAALADLEEVLGPDRPVVIAREMTKLHEQFMRGTLAGVRQLWPAESKGEITLVIGPPVESAAAPSSESLAARLAAAQTKDDLKLLARETGLARSDLYRRWQQLRGKMER
ncbi:MAG TPA: 16S rRNA (cytidine(1402)-2'-O)-methyltransferase [Terriglobales bacterium]|nr:16S rRNA (cytidine(1402)-2'-O)-methyltransferase [Terriglobales bacterium]